jgi:glutathione S-transferase
MSELILHHYSTSPFSEKVRLVLGYKKMPWRSVIVPNVMPKPDVMALTGGYRRTPFMQIGADIFCDSALMCRVIDALQSEPPLYPQATSGIADIVAQWADQTLFWTAVPYTMQPAAAPHIMKGATPESMKSFAADRAAMSPNFRRPTLADGATMLKTYLSRLEHMLVEGQPFLLGSLPSIADFAAVQSIWFMHLAPPIAAMLAKYPNVEAWYARVKDFGQGEPTPMTTAESIAVAAKGELVKLSFTPEPGLDQGDEVTVTPMDYAYDPVAGKLVGLSAQEVVVERTDDRAGKVHVHFPRIGFQIKKQPT